MPGLGALSFSSPLILLALAGLPVLWFILRASPPTPKREIFPAFVILKQLTNREETPARMPWLLLLLRLLALGLIILGLAGPILNAPTPAAAPRPLLIVVDNSWHAAPRWRIRMNALTALIAEARASGRESRLLLTVPPPGDSAPLLLTEPLSAAGLNDIVRRLSPHALTSDYDAARLALEDGTLNDGPYDIRWLTDGLDGDGQSDGEQALLRALQARGDVRIFQDMASSPPFLRAMRPGSDVQPATDAAGAPQNGDVYLERLIAGTPVDLEIVASARDGRELSRVAGHLDADQTSATIALDLPLALRSEIAAIRLLGAASAGGVVLSDARNARVSVGLLGTDQTAGDALLSGSFYIRKALGPFATFVDGSLSEMIDADISVIILDDVGRLRARDVSALEQWIENGGVLVRFAGPALGDAAQDTDPPLIPVPLRGGGRAFGGALTWETPQPLGTFAPGGPFAELTPPDDVVVRRQVLAAPGGATSNATWARLADGTPLVTGTRAGAGALVLFHTTATPDWSDLPLSQIFVDMLRKAVLLSVNRQAADDIDTESRFAPLRILDGYGALTLPPARLDGVSLQDIAAGPSVTAPPGLYGAPQAPFAVNAVSGTARLRPLALPASLAEPYTAVPPQRLAAPLWLIAAGFLIADMIASLAFAGQLSRRLSRPLAGRGPVPGATTLAALCAATVLITLGGVSGPVRAQTAPLDPPIDGAAREAALTTRLAYISSGDPQADRYAAAGLSALSTKLFDRTAFEPGAPVRVNPETDDLSVYPMIYWPIAAETPLPSEIALSNLETFMRLGGLIVFDTRDDERAVNGFETPEQQALRAILSGIDTPPLTPVSETHVLRRSFYLLTELPGRTIANPVWVEDGASDNDGVTSLIIGGRDWAGAWAADDTGRPLLPMARAVGGERAREYAYRAGINMVMVALTGNYKSDQVHTPILLQRLER